MGTLELQLESEPITQQQPSPVLFFETMHAYQRSAALKTAIELDLFTAIGETSGGLGALTERIGSPERGLLHFLMRDRRPRIIQRFLHLAKPSFPFRSPATIAMCLTA